MPELSGDLTIGDLIAIWHEGITYKYSMDSFVSFVEAILAPTYMRKDVYDTNGNNRVDMADDSAKFGGQTPVELYDDVENLTKNLLDWNFIYSANLRNDTTSGLQLQYAGKNIKTGAVTNSAVNLPEATAYTYGVVSPALYAAFTSGTSYTLPAATTTVLGGIKVGSNLSVLADGTLNATTYSLAPATSSTLGGVKVGSNLSVAADGTLSMPYTIWVGTAANVPTPKDANTIYFIKA
ncbi:hypothetical protein AGMMS50239_36680 [Bacteroidia bacterium]|nr:hypothetical protein AGMMS50239_36680 [Bacteroidia bacterium]